MARHAEKPPARHLWERIDRARVLLEWTDTELAERSGVARTTYARLKTGKRPPLPETVSKLADAVSLDRTEAFQLAGLLQAETPTEPYPIPDVEIDEEIEELLARLSPKRRAWLERIREAERERLKALQEQAATEVGRASRRFAELVRDEAESERTDD